MRRGDGPLAPFMVVQVPRQTVVRFRAESPNALLVTIADTEGALAAAGLEDGDVVLAIGGAPFRDEAELDRPWAEGIARGEMALTVARGPLRLEVRLPAAALRGADPGGRLVPVRR